MRRALLAAGTVIGTLIASACAASPGTPAATSIATQSAPSPAVRVVGSPSPVASPSSGSTQGNPSAQAAVRDAAARLGISEGDVKVEQLAERQWSDASLGCPRQGVLYAQVITPGFLIVVSGAGKELEYHADERGRVVLCAER